MWTAIRRYLLTGIAVIAPVGVTAFVLYWIFVRLDAILGRLLSGVFAVRFPGLGLLALVILLITVGWIAQQAIGRQVINLGKRWLSRFPLTRSIYNAASQIIETLVGHDRKLFDACVLVEYPRVGCWTMGFITNRAAREIDDLLEEELVAVFLPTSPNPTSGWIAFLPISKVQRLRMSVEDGFKLIISGGVVTPELLEQAAAAEAALRSDRWGRGRKADA